MRWGGFQKCIVKTRSGKPVLSAMAVMLRPEVLLARIVSLEAALSRRSKKDCLRGKSSGIDSITN
jgi:hypothetical protein